MTRDGRNPSSILTATRTASSSTRSVACPTRSSPCAVPTRPIPRATAGTSTDAEVIYRLPQVIAAVEAGATIYIPEGEKDVGSLIARGVEATCNPSGAGKWRPEYSEFFRGAHVVIIADRDDVGRSHASDVARSLDGIAASIRIVEAKVGKDASDHLAAGCSLDDFVPSDPATSPSSVSIIRVSEIAPEAVEWLWPQRVPAGKLTMLAGDPGLGSLAPSPSIWQRAPLRDCHGPMEAGHRSAR